MGDGVHGLWNKFFQGFPPRGEIVRVWEPPRQLPALRRPTSWRINLAAPRVRGVGRRWSKFGQGFPPRGKGVRVLPAHGRPIWLSISLSAPWVRGVGSRGSMWGQGFPPRVKAVYQVGFLRGWGSFWPTRALVLGSALLGLSVAILVPPEIG